MKKTYELIYMKVAGKSFIIKANKRLNVKERLSLRAKAIRAFLDPNYTLRLPYEVEFFPGHDN